MMWLTASVATTMSPMLMDASSDPAMPVFSSAPTPNREPVMDTAAVHAIEHLGATFLRNDPEWSSRVIYFGPMGCRTGFYLVAFGTLESADVADLVHRMFAFIREFEGEIPGAKPEECGNYHDNDLPQAKWWARRYLANTLDVLDDAHTHYPALLD